MNPLHWLSRPEFAALAAALVHFLWQGTLIALFLAAVLRLGRIKRAAQRYACSLAALVAMAICPAITFFVLAQQTPPASALAVGESSPAAAAVAVAPTPNLIDQLWLAVQALARGAQPYLLALWLAGVCLLSGWLFCGIVGSVRLSRRRLPLPLDLARRVEQLGQALNIDALPLVFLSRSVSEALVIGFWRPVVLVPAAWATDMPLVALEAIIAHELAHIRRWDLWVNLLQRVVETLLFYHPAVWWVSRQLRTVREMCCDELAVGATGRPVEYAETLELVARERLAGVRPALAAGIRGETNMNLLARVRNVLGGTSGDAWTLWPAGLLALLLPLGLWGATLGVLSLSAAAAVAAEDDDDDDDRDDADDDDEREAAREKKKALREANAAREDREEGEERVVKKRDLYRIEGEAPKKKYAADDSPAPKKVRKEKLYRKKIGEEGAEQLLEPGKKRPLGEYLELSRDKKIPGEQKLDAGESAKMMAMLKELRGEVDRLRAEVRELREGQAAGRDGAANKARDFERRDYEELERERDAAIDRLKNAHEEGDQVRASMERALIDQRIKAFRAEEKIHAEREAKQQAAIVQKLQLAADEKERVAHRDAVERKAREAKEQLAIEQKQRLAADEKELAVARDAERKAREAKEREAAERKEAEENKREPK